MRKVVAGVIGVVLVAIVAYIALDRRGQGSEGSAGSAGGGKAATRAPEGPSLGSASANDPVTVKFQQRKADALVHMQPEIERRLRSCAHSGSSAGSPQTVVLALDWDERLSTPELQRFVVTRAELVNATAPVSPDSKRCLDTLQGATLNVLISAGELPTKRLSEPLTLPLE